MTWTGGLVLGALDPVSRFPASNTTDWGLMAGNSGGPSGVLGAECEH